MFPIFPLILEINHSLNLWRYKIQNWLELRDYAAVGNEGLQRLCCLILWSCIDILGSFSLHQDNYCWVWYVEITRYYWQVTIVFITAPKSCLGFTNIDFYSIHGRHQNNTLRFDTNPYATNETAQNGNSASALAPQSRRDTIIKYSEAATSDYQYSNTNLNSTQRDLMSEWKRSLSPSWRRQCKMTEYFYQVLIQR